MSSLTTQGNPELNWLAKLRLVGADIKLAHSVFALPFALLGAFLVAPGDDAGIDWSRFGGMLALVVVCMFFARTWAMVTNRVADREIDAANPRTARRAFAAGALSGRDGLLVLAGSALAFVGVCALYWVLYANPWPTLLSGIVLAWIAFYSYTKRFTWLCHVFLGG
ncbi:MAG: UbiA family prenyltransferase, partial [Phycisphaerales bacterium JB059]